ncbi:helix-turn-helix domain-containing protein [Enterovirga sp. CN4-39]|uniref:helix-turn-helix domain-containing protein n=1 Tax=Enterovirga sp. CN4-39 TaxID=3400910 RepID=UPI003C053B46
MLDPGEHAEHVTGRKQSALLDLWPDWNFAAALSEVTGPHVYEFGALSVPTVAITLYNVRRHVLIEDGRVRRDGSVRAGRFRIGQPSRNVLVDAVPDAVSGKLVLLYLGDRLRREAAAALDRPEPIELADHAWDAEDPFLAQAAQRLVEASDTAPPGRRLFAETLALSLACHVTQRYAATGHRTAPPSSPQLSSRALKQVVEFVRASPGAEITTDDLARISGLSASHLIRAFKRSTGLTPHRFVIRERVAMAQELLAGTNEPIAEIAVTCGFSSQSHLGAAFRSIIGTSPAQYRRIRRS